MQLTCTSCGNPLEAVATEQSTLIVCPKCSQVLRVPRTAQCDRLTTEVVAVSAEDDLVTVIWPRSYADPRRPGQCYSTTWFDTWRFVNGKADEHWDPATVSPPPTPMPCPATR